MLQALRPIYELFFPSTCEPEIAKTFGIGCLGLFRRGEGGPYGWARRTHTPVILLQDEDLVDAPRPEARFWRLRGPCQGRSCRVLQRRGQLRRRHPQGAGGGS